jgi:hypothetical protein
MESRRRNEGVSYGNAVYKKGIDDRRTTEGQENLSTVVGSIFRSYVLFLSMNSFLECDVYVTDTLYGLMSYFKIVYLQSVIGT